MSGILGARNLVILGKRAGHGRRSNQKLGISAQKHLEEDQSLRRPFEYYPFTDKHQSILHPGVAGDLCLQTIQCNPILTPSLSHSSRESEGVQMCSLGQDLCQVRMTSFPFRARKILLMAGSASQPVRGRMAAIRVLISVKDKSSASPGC
jgi:hypothetical protein